MKVTYKGRELPFSVPISAENIPEEYFDILQPLPDNRKYPGY